MPTTAVRPSIRIAARSCVRVSVNSCLCRPVKPPRSDMKRVHVVAGVVLDESRTHVLLAERRADQHQGGLWEYPGGKCEPGESEAVALTRELAEEIGIDATEMSPLMVVEHDYPDKSVTRRSMRSTISLSRRQIRGSHGRCQTGCLRRKTPKTPAVEADFLRPAG